MTEEKKTIREIVESKFNEVADKSTFKDKKIKKQFFDELEANNKELKRSSIESTFSTLLKKHCKDNKIDFNEFSAKPTKRFSSSIDLSTTGKPINVEEEKDEKKQTVKVQNPNAKKLDDDNKPTEYPLEAVAGSINSFTKAIIPEVTDMTQQEREDASVCLNMAFGNILDNSAKMRAIFGGAGLLGIYGGKIGEARKLRKQMHPQQTKQEPKQEAPKQLPEITEQEREQFAQNQENFLEEQRKLYEAKKQKG